MRIAYICSMKQGLTSFIFREIKHLYARGIVVDIFTTKYKPGIYMPQADWRYFHFNPYLVILYQPAYLVRYNKEYIRLFMEALATNTLIDFFIAMQYAGKIGHADRIHCHEAIHPFFIGYYCSKLLDIPLSVTIHADTFYVNPNPAFAKIALRYCDAIITISDYNKNILVNDYKLDEKKVCVIRLGIDTKEFDATARKSVMIVGQYAERKGHEDLFKAFKHVNRKDVDLWVVGIPSWGGKRDRVDVHALVKKYDLKERVIFFENIPEKFVRFLYSQCTVFCLPSKKSKDGNCEGLPVSLMEAMASKKPVISTTHTGIPELVKHILVPEGDWEALARNLSTVLNSDAATLQKMGEENRRVIEEDYSMEKNVQALADFFARQREGRKSDEK